ncbi:histidine kinase [Jiella sp. M17.18]|uniref:sensor histidine kinase n=1 Tax=Jiella sp. M17.18 TaxID=3234247 RepID=UPI0034DFA592
MSLKARLAATLSIAFLVILVIGGLVTYRQARLNIVTELSAARSVATNRVAQLVAELPATPDVPAKLAAFVRTFNGDRYVKVILIDALGVIRDQSHPAKDYDQLPDWFVQLLSPDPSTTIMPLSAISEPITSVAILIDPRNILADTWFELLTGLGILILFVVIAFVAVWIVADRALRPLAGIQAAFLEIGAGNYAAKVRPFGPPEMRRLADGCNEMSERLDEISARNRRLSEQLLRLQDEERADLARDLHDEVGPLLFAIDVDASAIGRMVRPQQANGDGPGDGVALRSRAEAIKGAAHRARREVRRILTNLRPGTMPGLGLKASIEDLVADLSRRHPEVAMEAAVPDGDWGATVEVLVHRVVREAMNNALRHGAPTRISVAVAAEGRRLRFSIVDDGGGLPEAGTAGGFGLIGMRERVEATGGELTVVQVPLPPGVRVEGWVPLGEGAGPAEAVDDGEPGTGSGRDA